MSKKYKPQCGHKIEFYYKKEKHTGTINFVGHSAVSVYPHSLDVKNIAGVSIDMDWWVENADIIV